ncbi:MAG TPA: CARDB domain-containing protein [Polyangiaceae bacterium]|nr:CARDB domain-containing protein [Polyangiaceae bacterium]
MSSPPVVNEGPIKVESPGATVGMLTMPTGSVPGATEPDQSTVIVDDGKEDTAALPTGVASAGAMADPCEVAGCGPGQRCEQTDTSATCVDVTCAELTCAATEQCRPDAQGGNICVDISCDEDVDCQAEEFCGPDHVCVPDACAPGTRVCDGLNVSECASNGSGMAQAYTCGSQAYFDSQCVALSDTDAGCSCQDDWDCPAYTVCEVNICRGTGVAPTCTVPPSNFADTKPSEEIFWGGASQNAADLPAHDGSMERNPAPWANSSQTTASAMVANLDDDNGDGAINELDFPEIIFTTYQGAQGDPENGVLRAIHGGGPNRGKDFFARCGDALWHEGDPLDADPCTTGGDAHRRMPVAVGDLTGDGVPEIVYTTINRGFRVLSNTGELLLDEGATAAFVDPLTDPAAMPDPMPSATGTGTAGGGMAGGGMGGGMGGGGFNVVRTVDRAPPASIANLDFSGLPELIFAGSVFVLGMDDMGKLFVDTRYDSTGTQGDNDSLSPMSCVADLNSAPGQEILAGTTLYSMPAHEACATPPCSGMLDIIWSAESVNPDASDVTDWNGYCAVADVWGKDHSVAPGPANPPDAVPEAVVIANGKLLLLEGETGTLIRALDLGGGQRGGAPNVDDFDGDGYAEIASALQDFYVVIDLQDPTPDGGSCPAWPTVIPRPTQAGQADNPNLTAGLIRNPGGMGSMSLPSGAVVPGSCASNADCDPAAVCNLAAKRCTCLHNGWSRDSDDDSSRATSSSVFDFNGDGAAEAIYNDECNFRIYDGSSGEVLFSEVSRSRTVIENPIVADVDNDGNAEVVTITNTEQSGRCDDDTMQPTGPHGLRVWGDAQDTWVGTRRIWNQQSYSVTNVTENAIVPDHPPESWGVFEGRYYDTYRSQPRSYGVAPDLTVVAVSLFSPDAGCGQLSNTIQIVFEVKNAGDQRVGPGVQVGFFGTWAGTEEALNGPDGPLSVVLDTSIEPGKSVIRTVTFNAADQTARGKLPDSVRVLVDSATTSTFGSERECHEDNNDRTQVVDPGIPRPDLSIAVGEATVKCSTHTATVAVTVSNAGTADATGVVVQIFAGDPGAGGSLMQEVAISDPIPAMGQVSLMIDVPNFPNNREITLWGWVDPHNTVEECNEGDNTDPADNPIACRVLGGAK